MLTAGVHVKAVYIPQISAVTSQSWKVIEKLRVLREKRNVFESEKQKAKVKKIEKLKAKSKSFIYITFLSPFPFFSQLHCMENSKISFRVL